MFNHFVYRECIELEKSKARFVKTKDKEGKKYLRFYFEDDVVGGIEEVVIHFSEDVPVIKEGKLYSYKRLQQERENAYDSGYADGYSEGVNESEEVVDVVDTADYDKAFKDGYKQALADLEEKNLKQKKKLGVVKGKEGRKPSLSESERVEVLALRELGKSYREIGERFGVSHQTIKHIVKGR